MESHRIAYRDSVAASLFSAANHGNHKGIAVSAISTFQILRWGMSNLDLIEVVSDAAYGVGHSESCVEGWGHIKPAGDVLAPKADELVVMISSRDSGDEEEATRNLLDAFAERTTPRGNRPPRDGKWLAGGVELLKVLLPILLARLGS